LTRRVSADTVLRRIQESGLTAHHLRSTAKLFRQINWPFGEPISQSAPEKLLSTNLLPGNLQLSQFFELAAQPMAERAFQP
jgi:hypothetical protein